MIFKKEVQVQAWFQSEMEMNFTYFFKRASISKAVLNLTWDPLCENELFVLEWLLEKYIYIFFSIIKLQTVGPLVLVPLRSKVCVCA